MKNHNACMSTGHLHAPDGQQVDSLFHCGWSGSDYTLPCSVSTCCPEDIDMTDTTSSSKSECAPSNVDEFSKSPDIDLSETKLGG